MPIYEYVCDNEQGGCGHKFEEIQGFFDEPLKICPKCNEEKLKKLLGNPGSFIFKGSGFYATDYKNTGSTEA